jgi:hypothetical protein
LIDGDTARIGAHNTFTGANTFSGVVNFDGAVDFDGALDMTGGAPTVPTKAVGTNTTDAASCAFVQAAAGKVYVQKFDISGGASQTYTPQAVRGPVSDAIQRRPPDLQITYFGSPRSCSSSFRSTFPVWACPLDSS